jgi:hypothetical protein
MIDNVPYSIVDSFKRDVVELFFIICLRDNGQVLPQDILKIIFEHPNLEKEIIELTGKHYPQYANSIKNLLVLK